MAHPENAPNRWAIPKKSLFPEVPSCPFDTEDIAVAKAQLRQNGGEGMIWLHLCLKRVDDAISYRYFIHPDQRTARFQLFSN